MRGTALEASGMIFSRHTGVWMTTTDSTKGLRRASRRRIATAARACFAEVGFQTATMDMIADRAGMSVGAIYRIYSQKSILIEDVVRREIAGWLIGARILLAGMNEVGESLGSVRTVHPVADWQDLRLYVETMAEAARNPTVSSIVASCDRHLRTAFVNALTARAKVSAEVRAEIATLVDVLLTVLHGLLLRATRCHVDVSEMIVHALRLILGMCPGAIKYFSSESM